ncbi:MAG: deoxyhypusine synthase [Candidatus Aenigmarchaeota archaeon]|nr:deoxyhypusine synthase [Candidatus Aenigmarchaeota archaeon]
MEFVKGFKWKYGITVKELVEQLSAVGFQAIHAYRAGEIILKMKREKAKIILAFTSNLGGTSGLRDFIAQLVKLGVPDILVTTAGSIEEDIMKAMGEKFLITKFTADDVELHEKGINRIGNLAITNDSYVRFEGFITRILKEIYKQHKKLTVSELLHEIGKRLNDENSFLYQAAKRNVPIYCPAITDGAIGFHLFMAQEYYPEFVLDVVNDFKDMVLRLSPDERKGVIVLGGGVSKHFALLSTMLSGGADYAVYITTSREISGSLSGAQTREAKSWGKVKDDSDAVTVHGDATILFPLIMSYALDKMKEEGLIKDE